MPTIHKRIMITPSPLAGPVLIELAKLTGRPESAWVREMLDEAVPAMTAMVQAFRALKRVKSKGQAEQVLSDFAKDIVQEVQRVSAEMQAELPLNQVMTRKPGRKPRKGAAKT